LAVTGWEMIVVVGVLAVIFVWGPNKIPELAKSVGQARREFEKATRELTTFPSEEKDTVSLAATTDNGLISAAKKIGIVTEGKTKSDIAKEIAWKTIQKKVEGTVES
jgi:sec-independent protein translocase protein TatA